MSRLQTRKHFKGTKSFRTECKGQVRALALGLRSRRERETVAETTESQLIMTWGLCKWRSVCADLTVLSAWKQRQSSFSGSHKATRSASQQTLVSGRESAAPATLHCQHLQNWDVSVNLTWFYRVEDHKCHNCHIREQTNPKVFLNSSIISLPKEGTGELKKKTKIQNKYRGRHPLRSIAGSQPQPSAVNPCKHFTRFHTTAAECSWLQSSRAQWSSCQG